MNIARGVVCAGGHATRLGELTREFNKHLLPVHKWPMVYYPLKLLEFAGIINVMVITGKEHAGQMIDQLGDGDVQDREGRQILSLNLTYRVQTRPGGIAQAVGLAKDFCRDELFVVILGDNITQNNITNEISTFSRQGQGARILLSEVPDPQRFGVPRFDDSGKKILEIIEKPADPPSKFAVIGIYMYNPEVFQVIDQLKPSGRGELEITDVNNWYLQCGKLSFGILEGWWRDVGTFESLTSVSELVQKTGACGIRF